MNNHPYFPLWSLHGVQKPVLFTMNQWYMENNTEERFSRAQQELADRILAESNRISDEIAEKTLLNKLEVDHKLKGKVEQIEFLKHELELLRKKLVEEIDTLNMFLQRLEATLRALREKCMIVCIKCLHLRDERIGIDLCFDDVEKELKKEAHVIESSQQLLSKCYAQVTEEIRALRSSFYFIDKDLQDKSKVLEIDTDNKNMKETSLNLNMYHGFTRMDVANITEDEWEKQSITNIEKASQEINAAIQLQTFIDQLIKQTIQDLVEQYNRVNEAFRRRIEETKSVKSRLEVEHSEITRQINEMVGNITKLEITIQNKEGFMALAHTRMGRRAHRPGAELCRDLVDTKLSEEVRLLRENMAKLQHMLTESQASLRYLLKTQIQLEENMNIKLNSLKIDEVYCMTLREGMNYKFY